MVERLKDTEENKKAMVNHTKDADDRIYLCKKCGKNGYKKGKNGFCYTFNKNKKSQRKAFELAKRKRDL